MIHFILSVIALASFSVNPYLWKERAYLATYPRSGNHWMRYLVEEATHIATSSVYPDGDPPHLKQPFPWGGYCPRHGYEGICRYPKKHEMALVKTHYPAFKARPYDNFPYEVVIHIVRNPIPSLYSFYKYQNGDQTTHMIPTPWLKNQIAAWKRCENHWINQPNVLIIRYEDLLNHPDEELKRVLTALHYSFTDADIQRAVTKHPPLERSFNQSSYFSEEDLVYLKTELEPLMKYFKYL